MAGTSRSRIARQRETVLLALVVAVTLLLCTVPASAHQSEVIDGDVAVAGALDAAPGAGADRILLVVALAVSMLSLARHRRLARALVIVTSIMVFETGLHSAHHLGRPGQEKDCGIATLAGHEASGPVDAVGVIAALLPARPLEPEKRLSWMPQAQPSPHDGRAPPASAVR